MNPASIWVLYKFQDYKKARNLRKALKRGFASVKPNQSLPQTGLVSIMNPRMLSYVPHLEPSSRQSIIATIDPYSGNPLQITGSKYPDLYVEEFALSQFRVLAQSYTS